jgi:hypothetical protein
MPARLGLDRPQAVSSNASIERTHTGMALRPRSAQAHVAQGGLHAMPVRPAHVER